MEVDTVHIRGILSALNKGAVFIFCGSSMLQLLLIRSNIATTPFWNFFVSMVVLLFFTFVFNVAGYTKGCNRSLFNRNNQVLFLILFLAIGCAKGSENGEILAGQVDITWPKNHVTYSSWHWLLLHLCVQSTSERKNCGRQYYWEKPSNMYQTSTTRFNQNGVAFVSVCLCGACKTLPRQYETNEPGNEQDLCLDSNDEEWVDPWM